MAVGTPVVASNVDGLPHVLGDAPAGGAWLVDADDRQAWRMAIREALSRRRDARLGELLSNFAHSRFGYEQAISQWDMLLSELAAT
jgi:glycosyltransferase involved in cell wall biosynthesis